MDNIKQENCPRSEKVSACATLKPRGRGPSRGSWVMGRMAGRYAARGGPLRGSWWAATRRVAGRYAARGGRRAA
jgi:hypothetical protein